MKNNIHTHIQNYGVRFDETGVGILGPVVLATKDRNGQEKTVDISNNEWIYKVGLQGQIDQLYSLRNAFRHWFFFRRPRNKPLVWYKVI